MKFTSIIIGALATIASASAVPTAVEEKRSTGIGGVNLGGAVSGFDANLFNNFQFKNADIGYFWGANAIGFEQLQLAALQGLNVEKFRTLFFADKFGVNELVLLTQAKMFSQFAGAGLVSGFDLSKFDVFGLGGGNDFGFNGGLAFDQLAVVDLNQFINAQLAVQLKQIAFSDCEYSVGPSTSCNSLTSRSQPASCWRLQGVN